MKVLQLTQRFPPAFGGVEDHVNRLARGLGQAGIEVEVATTDLLRDIPLQRIDGALGSFPFRVRRFRAHKFLDIPHGLGIAAPAMAWEALSSRADLLHAHAYGFFPTWAGGLGGLLNRSAVVITPHSDAGGSSVTKRWFDRVVPVFTLRRATRVIALTRREAAFLETLGVHKDRIAVIPNGIDVGEFAGIDTDRPSSGTATALYVGRIYPRQKGLETLLRALALLHPDELRLRIVGEDWDGADTLRALGRKLGLLHRVEFVGRVPRDALIREYARADLLVLPSLFEPFGIVLLEAMAAGLPVVASRVGGIPDVVEDDETGLLVDPSDPEALAGALRALASNPARRRTMGLRGRERAAAYSWDSLIPKVMRVYEEALQERGR